MKVRRQSCAGFLVEMGGEESEKVLRRDGMKIVFARTSPHEFAGWGYPLELGYWDTESSASLAIHPEAPPTTEPEAGSRTQVPGRLVHVLGWAGVGGERPATGSLMATFSGQGVCERESGLIYFLPYFEEELLCVPCWRE